MSSKHGEQAQVGTPDGDRRDRLADLIEAYEYATEPWVREELALVEAEKARRQVRAVGMKG